MPEQEERSGTCGVNSGEKSQGMRDVEGWLELRIPCSTCDTDRAFLRALCDYHTAHQQMKGPISASLLFLQGLAVGSEPKP